jgi:hypothetical protein
LVQTEAEWDSLRRSAAKLAPGRIATLEEAGGGRNSRVYRMTVEPRGCYALKAYFRHASDGRARMETEFASLVFLWENAVRNIPRPVAASEEEGLAVYQWIEGRKMAPHEVTAAAIDAATDFLGRLADLRRRPGSSSLRPASEACFSGGALLENLQRRLAPLRARPNGSGLRAFLEGEFVPAFDRISHWARERAGETFEPALPAEARTLSPSDFGFHNALAAPGGGIYFLDFEYFGWDDPAKTVCDFLLHPAMMLPAALKRQFAKGVLRSFSWCAGLARRVEAFYPLFGLKWCLILLNEFLPEQLLRRQFAGMSEAEARQKQEEQLTKAERMLRTTLAEYEHFSYFD